MLATYLLFVEYELRSDVEWDFEQTLKFTYRHAM